MNNWKKVTAIIVILGFIGVLAGSWYDHKADAKVGAEKLKTHMEVDRLRDETVKNGGTEVCDENTVKIVAIQKDIEYTKEAVKAIRVEQRVMRTERQVNFKELMEAIKEEK